MLKVTDLAASYGMHEALSGISLQVESSEIVVILGANGAGKSTVLKAISGVCEGSYRGDISLQGQSIKDLDPAQIVAHGIAFVPEGRGIFGDLSVYENLMLGAYTDHARHKQQENLERVLTLFPKLTERQKQIARTMSGGEQQMVAIGRALMSAPSILMLDEPSLGLSPLLCKELFSSLKQVRETGVGILLVEQNARQSLGIADRGYLLENGRITGHDNAQKLLHDPAVQAAYLGAGASKSVASVRPGIDNKFSGATATEKSPAIEKMFEPRAGQGSATVSADVLTGVNIDALVARASSAVARPQTSASSRDKNNALTGGRYVAGQADAADAPESLPSTQDSKVRQLIADFEQAALNASSGAGQRKRSEKKSLGRVDHDDLNSLPHIPVFRKNPVTVYRRDHAGKLRKQERS
ncbi:hypothetical protein AB833_24475 [Chromatiales bacterium (ex Bugula neritina AB1)]|nr:hypothetical protein AB833_24475 [Chromatiales bacterium (ex Bugula neritina AB1)]